MKDNATKSVSAVQTTEPQQSNPKSGVKEITPEFIQKTRELEAEFFKRIGLAFEAYCDMVQFQIDNKKTS